MRTTVTTSDIGSLTEGNHENPHHVLGPHHVRSAGRDATAIRAYLPHSSQAWVVDETNNTSLPMRRIHPSGLFEAVPSEGKVVANPDMARRASLDEILWVGPGGGSSDVQVVYENPAVAGVHTGLTALRLPAWDQVWVLEVDSNARWVNDPTFRRWLDSRIDRWRLVDSVFEENGEPLTEPAELPGRRPVSQGARPRLTLLYDGGKPAADRIVSRLRADLLAYQVVLEPVAETAGGDLTVPSAMRLTRLELDQVDSGRSSHEIITLVRVHAWLLTRKGLRGIKTGSAWQFDFDHARWEK